MKPIILASTSPRRKEIFAITGLKFKVVPSEFEEDLSADPNPVALVKKMSLGKALAIAHKYQNAIVIAADTIVVYKGKALGKPHTQARAKKYLRELSGKRHEIMTAFTILDTLSGKIITKCVKSEVHFRKISPREINAYVKTGEPLDRAGGYAVQGLASIFINKIVGDYFGIVGLPLRPLMEELKKFGISIF